MLSQAMDAFNQGNADAARATMGMAKQVDRTFDNIFDELVHEKSDQKLKDIMGLFVVFHRLERVAGQSKNLCEETIFAATGQGKAPKVYRILFLDRDGSCLAPMAEAIARKNYPNSGSYRSAGSQGGGELNASLLKFLEQHGLALDDTGANKLDLAPQELNDLHVIVSLQDPINSHIPELPFHTVGLEWDLGSCPEGLPEEEAQQRLEALYREIAAQVQELMETLRGEGAN
jgi:protein-tyrosine-phosphatase